jgi:alpha-amylase/alpha-mannosidase (GH57 family)
MNVVDQVQAHDGRLAVFFRDDVLSNLVSFRKTDAPDFLRRLRDLGNYHPGDVYVVTAQDAETFGHHIKDWEKEFLGWVFQELGDLLNGLSHEEETAGQPGDVKTIRVVTISQLLEHFPAGPVVEPHPSSWSTTADDLKGGNPYPLWSAPGNRLHALLWEHLELTIGLANSAQSLAVRPETRLLYKEARATLDEALHSDQFWWASRRPMWNTDMVHRGVMLQQEALVLAYNVIESSDAPAARKRELYYKVLLARGLRAQIEDLLLTK